MTLPNFLYIGTAKSGSSWLYEILRAHPQCFLPKIKDIYFFDRYYHRGLDWYEAQFRGVNGSHIAVGEICHDYLFSLDAANRIREHLPRVKLLVTLRNPVEQCFSRFLFHRRSGGAAMAFEEYIDSHPQFLLSNCLTPYLKEYYSRFSREQIMVMFFDDLEANPALFARRIFDYLNLPFVEDIDFERRILPAAKPRNVAIVRAGRAAGRFLRNIGAPAILGIVKRSPLMGLLFKPYDSDAKPRIRPETESRLKDFFRDDIARIGDLTGRDLSHWIR